MAIEDTVGQINTRCSARIRPGAWLLGVAGLIAAMPAFSNEPGTTLMVTSNGRDCAKDQSGLMGCNDYNHLRNPAGLIAPLKDGFDDKFSKARGSVEMGRLRLYAYSYYASDGFSYMQVGSGGTKGTFQDNITLHVPGVADGTRVTFLSKLFVGGDSWTDWSPPYYGSIVAETFFRVAGSSHFNNSGDRQSGDLGGPVRYVVPSAGAPGPLSILLQADVVLGEAFPVYAEFRVGASVNGGGFAYVARAIADFEHTAAWGGIEALTLQDGTRITDFTASGTSGFDWKPSLFTFTPIPAVPEPAAVLLLPAGLALLAARRRWVARSSAG